MNAGCKRFQEGGDDGRPSKATKFSQTMEKTEGINGSTVEESIINQVYFDYLSDERKNSVNLELIILPSSLRKMSEDIHRKFSNLNSSITASPPARAL